MKKLTIFFLALGLLICSCAKQSDLKAVSGRVDQLEQKVAYLEELCKNMNTNISSIQVLVNALEDKDFIKSIDEIVYAGDVVGYTIKFNSGKSVTIYHGEDGEDGKDGQDGQNGQDGHTPVIGVKKGSDGMWYWTVDGEWLVGDDGEKIPAVGADGEDGEDGKDGEAGENGKDGLTPELKIEDGMWYITYDSGKSWYELGPAAGADGKDGDSMFQSVDWDENEARFTLADGTVLTIPMGAGTVSNLVQSLTYVPEYNDGMALIKKTAGVDEGVGAFDFEVSPKEFAEKITKDMVSMKAVYTQTRSESRFVNLPVVSVVADSEDGIITVTVSGENLSDDFYAGKVTASAALTVSDGETDITSAYVPLIAEYDTSAMPVITYTTTDGLPISYKHDKLISNVYENGVGTLTFSEPIKEVKGFADQKKLATVNIPTSAETIYTSAFEDCTHLTEIVIPDNVMYIYSDAFYGCTLLKKVVIGNGVLEIGQYAFSGCPQLSDLTLGSSLKEIAFNAFNGISIPSLVLPESLEILGNGAFNSCKSLESVKIGSRLEKISDNAFEKCANLTDLTIGSGVVTIGTSAFKGCIHLTEVTIPDNVMYIYSDAFYGCTLLKKVVIGNGVLEIGQYAFSGCPQLSDLTLGASLKDIAFNAFSGTSIPSLVLPESLEFLGNNAFNSCKSLESVKIGNRLEKIGDNAFEKCANLTDLTIGSGVVTIGASAFKSCTHLTEVTIPDNVMYIYSDAFYGCTLLNKVIIGNGVLEIGQYAFSGCPQLSDLTLGASLKEIAFNAFSGTSIPSLVLPESLEFLGNNAFNSCKSLESVKIGNRLEKIGDNAFEKCANLTDLTIGSGVVTIGASAFKSCTHLTEVTIPDNVMYIYNDAFYGCTSLNKVELGSGVLEIGQYAFSSCQSLAEFYAKPSSAPSLGYNAFDKSPISSIFVPTASLADYQSKWSSYSSYLKGYNF